MDTSLLLGMINNVALLLVLGIILDFTGSMHRFNKPFLQKLVSGTLVGVLGIAVILTPWDLRLGFVLNSRTIFFAIAGLFFGPIPLVAAVLMSGLFQFAQGGSGVLWGLLPIITSAALGLLWRLVRWRGRDLAAISIQEWVLFALLVHSVLAFELLPQTRMFPPDQWIRIGLIILVVYPLATVLLGIFMAGRLDRSRKLSAWEDSGERRKIPLQNAAKIITDNSTQQKHAEERRLHPME
jgi:LytS/YehU family sensor histidine kinase